MALRAAAGAAAVLWGLCCSAWAAEVSIDHGPQRGDYRVKGEFAAQASPAVAWEVITDYDGLARFVSSIKDSRILRRDGNAALIEQEGKGRFFFVSRRVKLKLEVVEDKPWRVDFKDVDGAQFRKYEGSWRIEPSSSGCVVSYELRAEPDPSLGPRFAARSALRANARRLLDEVRKEIKRRADAKSPEGS